MEIHQVVGLIAIQVIVLPGACAASALIGEASRALGPRAVSAGRRATGPQSAEGWTLAPKLAFLVIWVLFNAMILFVAGII